LASGNLRCIGSTTYKEFRNYFEKDRALVRRFQKIDVNEPNLEDAVKILRGLKLNYEKHHKDALHGRGDPCRGGAFGQVHPRPQAAGQGEIDVIDEVVRRGCCCRRTSGGNGDLARRGGDRRQDRAHSPKSVSADDKETLRNLETRHQGDGVRPGQGGGGPRGRHQALRAGSARYGKSPSVTTCSAARPAVGKTEVARQLSSVMGIELIRFDMSEYMERHSVSRLLGAPPGYVGFDQGGLLTDAIDQHPHARAAAG